MNPNDPAQCLVCGEERTHSIVCNDNNFQYCEECLSKILSGSNGIIALIDKADARAVHAENLALQCLDELTTLRTVIAFHVM